MNLKTAIAVAIIAVLAAGCTTGHYRRAADREVAGIIAEKSPQVPNMDPDFTIDREQLDYLSTLPPADETETFLRDAGVDEHGSKTIGLEKALEIGVKNSRTYQSEKESLYRAALTLTNSRQEFEPFFNASAAGSINRRTRDVAVTPLSAELARRAPGFVEGVGGLLGTPADLISAYSDLVATSVSTLELDQDDIEIMEERTATGATNIGVDILLAGGTRIASDLTSNFLKFLTGNREEAAASVWNTTVTRPLLRGAGREIIQENLTQAERNVLYSVRDFTRFRKEFTVGIASDYYGVLQTRDAARNTWKRYQDEIRNQEFQEAQAESGRISKADLFRFQQNEIDAENAWISAVRGYRNQLDRFKISLGLSTDADVVLDDEELARLMERGLLHPTFSPEEAIEVALAARLDLYTARDSVDDTGRQLRVAANALKADVDFIASASVPTMPGNQPLDFDFERMTWSAGLDIDLPVERKAERNQYRVAIISYDQRRRSLTDQVDNVKLSVRQALRSLEEARIGYDTRKKGVEINTRWVEQQQILMETGRANALDIVDAGNVLTASRIQLTGALVDHTIARLNLFLDMGILFIKEDGQWEEVTDDYFAS
jgi:outer membrane protein TolC